MWKLRAEVGAEVESRREQKEGAEVECGSWEQRLRVEESGPLNFHSFRFNPPLLRSTATSTATYPPLSG